MSPLIDPPPLASLTTMQVGAPATEHWRAETRDEIVEAAAHAWSEHDRTVVLGGGSNIVAPGDADGGGFDGAIVQIASRGIQRVQTPTGDGVRLWIEAGHSWDDLVAQSVAEGWTGIEALSGIPGSVGAAPVQNIGAYGQELASVLVSIEFLDEETGALQLVSAHDLRLGYRTSAIKEGRRGIVTAVELELDPAADRASAVRYPQLATALGVPLGARVDGASIREAVLELRRSKGMVLDAADPASVGCGSFFVNPVVTAAIARTLPEDAPRWPVGPGAADLPDIAVPLGDEPAEPNYGDGAPAVGADVKLSAAWLIERAGIGRGFTIPGLRAGVSPKHTLAIINLGGATADDVLGMATYIQTRVAAEFGVVLQPEPTILVP